MWKGTEPYVQEVRGELGANVRDRLSESDPKGPKALAYMEGAPQEEKLGSTKAEA